MCMCSCAASIAQLLELESRIPKVIGSNLTRRSNLSLLPRISFVYPFSSIRVFIMYSRCTYMYMYMLVCYTIVYVHVYPHVPTHVHVYLHIYTVQVHTCILWLRICAGTTVGMVPYGNTHLSITTQAIT